MPCPLPCVPIPLPLITGPSPLSPFPLSLAQKSAPPPSPNILGLLPTLIPFTPTSPRIKIYICIFMLSHEAEGAHDVHLRPHVEDPPLWRFPHTHSFDGLLSIARSRDNKLKCAISPFPPAH